MAINMMRLQMLLKLFLIILSIVQANAVQAELQTQAEDTVRIGLMLSENPETDTDSREALFTVQYAANSINERGGLNGRKLEIISKSGDGDWGISSKRSVELIFDHEVNVIIGSLDGQNAHLTQMAITKAEVTYLSTRSTDPTLSNANIPWFFRVIPSDKQQSETLIQFIFKDTGLNNIAVIYSDQYNSRIAANTFNRLVSEMNRYSIQTFVIDQEGSDFNELLLQLNSDELQGIVIFGIDSQLKSVLKKIEEAEINLPVFLPLTVHNEVFEAEHSYEVYTVCPQQWPLLFNSEFINNFKKEFHRNPGLIAAYSYDGIQVLAESIRNNGSGRREIRDLLSDVNFPNGVTGSLRFNSDGDIINQSTICRR